MRGVNELEIFALIVVLTKSAHEKRKPENNYVQFFLSLFSTHFYSFCFRFHICEQKKNLLDTPNWCRCANKKVHLEPTLVNCFTEETREKHRFVSVDKAFHVNEIIVANCAENIKFHANVNGHIITFVSICIYIIFRRKQIFYVS